MATATAGALQVTLTANDKVSAPIARITAMAQRLGGNMGRLSDRMRGLGGMERLTSGARDLGRNLAAIVPPLSVLTGAGTIAGVVRLVSSFATMGAQLGRAAYRAQTTASGLSALQGAAQLAGVSAEDLTSGMTGLGDALVDAVGGRDTNALQYLSILGIQLRDAAGNARTATDVLPEVADGIARIANPALQARVMGALRLPEAMLPFLKRGSAGLREYEREARRLGAVTDDNAEEAGRLELAQARLNLAGKGLVNTIAARLSPAMRGLLDRMTEWISANREWIAQNVERVVLAITGAVERLAIGMKKWLDDGGWESFTGKIEAIGSAIEAVVGWMGGWENAATALGAVLVLNMVAPLASIVTSLGVLAAFRAPVWMMRLLAVGGGIPAVMAALGIGLKRLGDLRAERGTDTPEAQEERRQAMSERGRAGGFYDGPAEDPGGPDAGSRFDRFFRAVMDAWPGRREPTTGMPNRIGRDMQRSFTPGGAETTSADPAPGANARDPRGLRNNNPLNLGYFRGQEGLDPNAPSDGRFGRYRSMEHGIAQAVRQMQIHRDRRGADTIEKLVSIWAPPGENDTQGYIGHVERETGIGRGQRLDLNDSDVVRRLVRAMSIKENGRAPDQATVARGVDRGLGRSTEPTPAAAPAAAAPAPAQSPAAAASAVPAPQAAARSEVVVRFANAPAGMTTRARSADTGGVRIERAFEGLGGIG